MAAKRYPVPIVVVEVVARVAVATVVGVGKRIGPTVGVAAAEFGWNPEPVVVLAG